MVSLMPAFRYKPIRQMAPQLSFRYKPSLCLQRKRLAVVDFGPAWHCYSGQRAAYASGPTLTDRRHDEQRGSPYDAKCNVAEIGAVNMGEIGAVRKRSR